jgi:hypothetical protein
MYIMLFFMSYLVGFLSYFVSDDYVSFYLIFVLTYIVVMVKMHPKYNRYIIVHPIVLSFLTSLAVSFVNGLELFRYTNYIMIIPALLLLNGGNYLFLNNESNKAVIFFEKYFITTVLPIGLFFVITIYGGLGETSTRLFITGYFIFLLFLSYYITSFSSLIAMVIAQTSTLTYLFMNWIVMDYKELIVFVLSCLLIGIISLRRRGLRFSIHSKIS